MARIVVERDPEAAEAAGAAVLSGLQDFNRRTLGEVGGELVSVSVRDDDGAIAGGAVGEVGLGYLFVRYLWVDESLRGRDLGASVLRHLEEEARRLGAANAYVDSTDDQPRALCAVNLTAATSRVSTWRMPVPGEDPRGIWHNRYYVPGTKMATDPETR